MGKFSTIIRIRAEGGRRLKIVIPFYPRKFKEFLQKYFSRFKKSEKASVARISKETGYSEETVKGYLEFMARHEDVFGVKYSYSKPSIVYYIGCSPEERLEAFQEAFETSAATVAYETTNFALKLFRPEPPPKPPVPCIAHLLAENVREMLGLPVPWDEGSRDDRKAEEIRRVEDELLQAYHTLQRKQAEGRGLPQNPLRDSTTR